MKNPTIVLGIVLLGAGLVFASPAIGTGVDLSTVFESNENIIKFVLTGALPFITKYLTGLVKGTMKTKGRTTLLIAFGMSVFLAFIGGYFGIGLYAGSEGLNSSLNAVMNMIIAFVGSVAVATDRKNVALSTAEMLSEALKHSRGTNNILSELATNEEALAALDLLKEELNKTQENTE